MVVIEIGLLMFLNCNLIACNHIVLYASFIKYLISNAILKAIAGFHLRFFVLKIHGLVTFFVGKGQHIRLFRVGVSFIV